MSQLITYYKLILRQIRKKVNTRLNEERKVKSMVNAASETKTKIYGEHNRIKAEQTKMRTRIFGNIQKYMNISGIKQAELLTLIGISQPTWNRCKRGESDIGVDRLILIAYRLNTPVESLFTA